MRFSTTLFFFGLCIFPTTSRPFTSLQQPHHEEKYNSSNTSHILSTFFNPVSFTNEGLRTFFKEVYDHRLYKEFLPATFVHMGDFLEYSKGLTEPYDYVESVFSIFNQKIKDCLWINPFSLLSLLRTLPDSIGELYKNPEEKIKHAIRRCLHSSLLYRFQDLKVDPQFFITSVAEEIFDETQKLHEVYSLQTTTARFLENTLNKLVFNPHDETMAWEVYKELGYQLEVLCDLGIVQDLRTLNDLYWSLVCRFCYFIETTGTQMSAQCYATIKKDLASTSFLFLDLEEQEAAMITKRERLTKTLVEAEIKVRAIEQGLLIS